MGMELEPDSFFQCQYYVGLSWIYCKLVKGDKKKLILGKTANCQEIVVFALGFGFLSFGSHIIGRYLNGKLTTIQLIKTQFGPFK